MPRSGGESMEEMLRQVSAGDQTRAALVEVAGMFVQFFDALCQQGLTREEALSMTLAWLSAHMRYKGEGNA